KRIDLNESMVRAIARQAEAERTRRAKVINAEGEQQAAQKLLDAARILAPVPQAMQLRYLGTLFDIAGERTNTIVFPFPVDMLRPGSAQPPAPARGPLALRSPPRVAGPAPPPSRPRPRPRSMGRRSVHQMRISGARAAAGRRASPALRNPHIRG